MFTDIFWNSSRKRYIVSMLLGRPIELQRVYFEDLCSMTERNILQAFEFGQTPHTSQNYTVVFFSFQISV